MTLDDLKEVQKIDTEMLYRIDDICKKYNIKYFLLYGTLLGAVRHGGPIPWDDDIDIGMTRENYLKFLEVAETELGEQYIVKIMGSGSTKYLSEIKIGRLDTLYCLPGTEQLDIMNHVQLDIFLVDYLKYNNGFKKKIFEATRCILNIARLNYDEKKLLKRAINKSNHRFKQFYIWGLDLLHFLYITMGELQMEKIIFNMFVDKTGKSENMGVVLDSSSKKNTWPTDSIKNLKLLKYGDRNFPVPYDYDYILRQVYGDYMRLPDVDKRYNKYFNEKVFKYY